METNIIYNEDCIGKNGMCILPDKSIDMVLCDLPYGTTSCKWDSIIPFDKLWEQYDRVIKNNGAIVLFATEPFSSYLRLSNIKEYKYDWKWIKSKVGNFLNCKNSPMKKYEDIVVFSKGNIANGSKNMMKYYPQGLIEVNKKCNNVNKSRKGTTIEERPCRQGVYIQKYTGYPNNILEFKSEDGLHPTQKPVPLLEYLIKTYTNESEIVLDNCMGSGSTAIACINTNRKYIGFELDKNYFDIANSRVQSHLSEINTLQLNSINA